MRFGINSFLFTFPFTNQSTKWFKTFKKWGFDSVEIAVDDPAGFDPHFVKRKLDEAGLVCGSVCGCFGPDRDLRGDAKAQRNGLRYIKQCLDYAVALKSPSFIGPVYSAVGRVGGAEPAEYRKQWKTVVKNLKKACQYAEKKGKVICMEPLNRFESDFINTPRLPTMSKPRRYITPEGFRRIAQEHERIWSVERPRIVAEVEAAAALGDRSENAEYIYGKRKLRELDRRLRFLSERLDALTVVEPAARADGRAYFGAWVTVEHEDGDERTYRLVGPDESDAGRGLVSVDAPLGRALLGKREGDTARVQRPAGSIELTVIEIGWTRPRE